MKVHLNAFHVWDICDHYSLSDFADQLSKPVEFKYLGRKRACGLAVVGDYLVGLLAAATEQSKDPLLTKGADGKLKFVVLDTSGQGERQALSYFVINMKTGGGLISRYQGTGSVISLCRTLRNRYRITKRKVREECVKKLKLDGEDATKSAILKAFTKGKMSFSPIYREGTFEQLLSSLDVITELSYDEPNVKDPKYSMVSDQLKLDHRQLMFETKKRKKGRDESPANVARTRIVQFIKDKILGRNVKVATAKGKNSHGKNMPPVMISPDVDSFGEYEYNDVLIPANLAIDDVASVPMIVDMLKVAKRTAIITTPLDHD